MPRYLIYALSGHQDTSRILSRKGSGPLAFPSLSRLAVSYTLGFSLPFHMIGVILACYHGEMAIKGKNPPIKDILVGGG